MGRIADDAPGHEGYMERELEAEPDGDFFARDETIGSWWCASWISGLPGPTGRWRAACECGWRGDIVDHQAIAAIDPDHSPGHDMLDETVEDLLLAPWEHHIAQTRSLPDLHTAARAADAAQRALDEAVHKARVAGHSWARIAGQVGLSRQAAHARWAAKGARLALPGHEPPPHPHRRTGSNCLESATSKDLEGTSLNLRLETGLRPIGHRRREGPCALRDRRPT